MFAEYISLPAILSYLLSGLLFFFIGELIILPFRFKYRTKKKKEYNTVAPIDIKTLNPAESNREYSKMPQSVDGDSALKHYKEK